MIITGATLRFGLGDQRLARVRPTERVSHGGVVIVDEAPDSRLQCGHRGEAASPQTFAVQDAEHDLNLVEPRTVFGNIHEANAMSEVRQELLA